MNLEPVVSAGGFPGIWDVPARLGGRFPVWEEKGK
jgi:hypothetical protein